MTTTTTKQRMTTTTANVDVPRHPAPFSAELMPKFADMLAVYGGERFAGATLRVYDPFAGSGRVHWLRDEAALYSRLVPPFTDVKTYGLELMPGWAGAHRRTRQGDATLPPPHHIVGTMHAVVTSPCYGNRMADHHNAQDGSPRRSYAHYYGRDEMLAEVDESSNACLMHWGPEYRVTHELALQHIWSSLRETGVFLLNVKDHWRRAERQRVCDWWKRAALDTGFTWRETRPVYARGYRFGANNGHEYEGERVDHERIYVFTKDVES